MKAGWNDGSNTTVETPVTQPETATSVKYSDWAADDIYHAVDFGYLDAAEDKSRVPAVTDLLGADFTKAITRGQFAALAVRYYETLMTDLAGYDYTIPVNTGDDVFADSTGNEAIAKGTLKHFSIANGVYVYERRYGDHSVVVMLNGTDRPQTLDLKPYAEILPRKEATDFLNGQTRQLTDKLELKARDVLLLEF